MDSSTFNALNALSPYIEGRSSITGYTLNRPVNTDASACTAIGGTIQSLWAATSAYQISVCVADSLGLNATTTQQPDKIADIAAKSSNSTGIVVGAVVGSVGLVAIVIAFFLFKKYNKPKKNESTNGDYYREIPARPPMPPNPGKPRGINVAPLRQHRLELGDLNFVSNEPIGGGGYGEVLLGTFGGEQVAIKRLKVSSEAAVQKFISYQKKKKKKFIDEILLMSKMDSPYIVKFIGAYWKRPIEMQCVVEYMETDLRKYLANTSPYQYSWQDKYNAINSIALGLVYLHTFSTPIVHRDIKSGNVLMDSKKGVKLTDFGISREYDDIMTNEVGTYQWMAPEVIKGTNYSEAADVYSFGVLLSEFCTHTTPYSDLLHPESGNPMGRMYVLTQVSEGRLHPTMDGINVPSWVNDIAQRCLQFDPDERPSTLELASLLHHCQP